MYLHKKKKSTMYLLWSYCIVKHLLLLRWDTGRLGTGLVVWVGLSMG